MNFGNVEYCNVCWCWCEGLGAAWHLSDIEVEQPSTGHKYVFPCGRWLSTKDDDKQICRELTCANPPSPRAAKHKLCKHSRN